MYKAILMGVPHHSNLGDHAITIAERKFIKRYFSEYIYQEVAEEKIHMCIEKIAKHIENEDVIFLHGGGNLGDEYLFIEEGRRKIIEKFPNNKIIIFPQTMYFHEDEKGNKELEISKEIYNGHSNLVIMAREEKSYITMKKEFFNNKIFLTPDIVTILNEQEPQDREGALAIIRNDGESKLNRKLKNEIKKVVEENFNSVNYTDTAKGGSIHELQRKKELNQMFQEYRKAQIVITDRLHGMIFAAITGTPCIALDNYNHKIKYSAKWFKNLEYIKYVDTEEIKDINTIIQELKNVKKDCYSNVFSITIFDRVMQDIKEELI